MFKKSLKSVLLLVSIFTTLIMFAQPVQYIVTYSSSGLSTSETCNSFNNLSSPAVIGTFSHYPVCGGVTFDGTNLVLKTQYATIPSTNYGTA